MITWHIELAVKVALLLLAAVLVVRRMKDASAATRHWVLATAIVVSTTLPVIAPVLPTWRLGLTAGARTIPARTVGVAAATPGRSVDAAGPVERAEVAPTDAGRMFATVWMLGSAVAFASLFLELGRLRWLASKGRPVRDPRLVALAADVADEAGLRRRILLTESHSPALLATWGYFRPRLMLPSSARDWSDDRARIVFRHEVAHIRRGDWMLQLLSEVLRCLYWFNPVVWMAASRLRADSEEACDDEVLSGGVEASDYAAHLLELARVHGRMWLRAPAMARPSSLERRVNAMLEQRNRVSPGRLARIVVLASALTAAGAVGVVNVLAQAFSTFSGSVIDPTNRVLPKATLVLTNLQSQAKHEVQSDGTGRFEFVGLPPGSYTLDVSFPGFARLHGNVNVAGERVQRDVTLEVGSLEETIMVVARPEPSGQTPSTPPTPRPPVVRRTNEGCTPAATGGSLRPPRKLRDVKPAYPAAMEAMRAEGVVTMRATIDKGGDVSEALVTSPAQPEFDAASVEAVRQWQFDSTLLNCEPVDVQMKVTITFKYQR